MNPLSAWTFHRRHKRSTFLMIVLVSLATKKPTAEELAPLFSAADGS